MKNYVWLFLSMVGLLLLPIAAHAQLFDGQMEEEEPMPAAELPPLPVAEEEAAPDATLPQTEEQGGMTMEFPQLPPSRLCTKREVLGLWRLSMVFQTPRGAELDDYGNYPYQYLLFNNNDTFRLYKSATEENTDADVMRILQGENKVLEQFIVHSSGVLYLYKNGAAVDSMACFIVANPMSPFGEGQMLLMPPPERAHIRMVKVYQKVYSAPKATNKKRNRRNR